MSPVPVKPDANMDNKETAKVIRAWIAKGDSSIYPWPVDSCGYIQINRFSNYCHRYWHGKTWAEWANFCLEYAGMIEKDNAVNLDTPAPPVRDDVPALAETNGRKSRIPRMCIQYIGVGFSIDDTSGNGFCSGSLGPECRPVKCVDMIARGECPKKRTKPQED